MKALKTFFNALRTDFATVIVTIVSSERVCDKIINYFSLVQCIYNIIDKHTLFLYFSMYNQFTLYTQFVYNILTNNLQRKYH